jgi:hypothetical protein
MGNLGVGFSAIVIGMGGVAAGSAAIALICLRLFGAFCVDTAFAFFFLCIFSILGQRAAARYVPLHRSAVAK